MASLNQSTYWEPPERWMDVMNIIVFMVRFQLVSMKASHYAELQLSQRHRLGHLQESPFTQDQEQVSEGSNTADSDKKKEGDGE